MGVKAMDSNKLLKFEGTAGGYFLVTLVSIIASYIPFFGWAFAMNFMAGWVVENSLVNGKKVAGYGETLGFIFINSLLILVTLGIYMFWFVPKAYAYVMDHVAYEGETPAAAPAAPAAPEAPAGPAPLVQ